MRICQLMMTGVTAPGGGSPNHVDEASEPVALGGGGGEEKRWQGRKSETREEMRGKGRETTRHFESSVEWFGSTCGFDCYCKEGRWFDLVIFCRYFVCHTLIVSQF